MKQDIRAAKMIAALGKFLYLAEGGSPCDVAAHIKHWHDFEAENDSQRHFLRGAYYLLLGDHNVEPKRIEGVETHMDAARLLERADVPMFALYNKEALKLALEDMSWERSSLRRDRTSEPDTEADAQRAIIAHYEACLKEEEEEG